MGAEHDDTSDAGRVIRPTADGIEKEELKPGLKNRHIQMIAIGGAIGVGLFYGSSYAIQLAGPAVVLSYLIVGAFIYFVMRANSELAVEEPVSGAYASFAGRYISRYWGFFMGWNVVFIFTVGQGAEFAAFGHYVQYWFGGVPIWVSAVLAVAVVSVSNIVAVALYGEVEFWLAIVKVTAIIAMIVLGVIIMFTGLGAAGHLVGMANLTGHGGFFAQGVMGLLMSFVLAAFSFGGIESLSNTAAETVDVKRTIPRATNSLFIRILIFYVGAMLVMVTLFPWDEIGTDNSPFVEVFSRVGIPAAGSVINFVVITAALSAINSGIYVTSRMLYNQAVKGNAPSYFKKVNKRAVPVRATVAILVANVAVAVVNAVVPEQAFNLFSSVTTLGLVSIWATILLSQLRFRRKRMREGTADQILYKTPWWPWSSYISLAFLALVVVMIGFIPDMRSALWIEPIWIIVVYVLYRIVIRRRTRTSHQPGDSE
ncbi:MAG: amino acid permease [Propionibacteriaceae bacterium]|nr:amino acid permease [Propionibacteriaceae bacterium]